jgi:hypothetical protein
MCNQQKSMGYTQVIFTDYWNALDAKLNFQNKNFTYL